MPSPGRGVATAIALVTSYRLRVIPQLNRQNKCQKYPDWTNLMQRIDRLTASYSLGLPPASTSEWLHERKNVCNQTQCREKFDTNAW